MFSLKHITGLALASFLLTSCSPLSSNWGKDKAKKTPAEAVAKAKPKTTKSTSSAAAKKEAARIKANKEAATRRANLKRKQAAAAKKKKSSSTTKKTTPPKTTVSKPSTPPTPKKKPVVKPKSKYRSAIAIPGKEGFVFNPWTNKAVDVRGIPGGSVVRDPNDGNPDHKFRVP